MLQLVLRKYKPLHGPGNGIQTISSTKTIFNPVISIIVYTYGHTHIMMFFNVKQEPVTGDTGDIRESGVDTFQYVPLLPGLSSLLQNPYVFEEVAIKNSTSLCTILGIQINLN